MWHHFLPIMVINKTRKQSGFSLIELLVSLMLLTIIIVAVGVIYFNGLDVFNTGYARHDVRSRLSQGLELAVRNLRQARTVTLVDESSMIFTADLGGGVQQYHLYLYNEKDPSPHPPYTASTYELRWAQGAGAPAYGAGAILAENIAAPTTAPFIKSGSLITIDLSTQSHDQTIRLQTQVRPRNL